MEDAKLTLEAEQAIRKYMLRLISLPVILVSIVMFVMGYLINEVASGRAYNEAYQKAYQNASDKILSLTERAALAANEAERAKQYSEQIKTELGSISSEAKKIREELKTAEAFQSAENIVKEVATTLANREDFKKSILALTENELVETRNSVDSAHNRINNIKLQVTGNSVSSQFSCGQERKENDKNLIVMYGSRDGTSCGVYNLNYYKEIGLYVPKQ